MRAFSVLTVLMWLTANTVSPAQASGCGAVQVIRQRAVYAAPVKVVQSYDYRQFVAVPVVDAYQSHYYTSAFEDYRDKLLAELVRDLKSDRDAIRQELKQFRSGPGAEPVPPPRPGVNNVDAKLKDLVGAKCISCHGPTFKEKGGGHDFRDLAVIGPVERGLMYKAILDGTMPKGGKALEEQEVLLFHDYMIQGFAKVK